VLIECDIYRTRNSRTEQKLVFIITMDCVDEYSKGVIKTAVVKPTRSLINQGGTQLVSVASKPDVVRPCGGFV